MKKQRVDRVVESLALQSCRNTHIGSVLARGISGGEVCFSFSLYLIKQC